MKGDKVVIGTKYSFKEDTNEKVIVYVPKLDINKNWIVNGDNTVCVESAGAVFVGTTGIVDGGVIRVNKRDLKIPRSEVGNWSEIVEFVPVNLPKYQKVGYFPIENLRILSG